VSAHPKVVDDAHKAARSLEAYFLRRVLAEVKTSENSISGAGFAGDTFKDMFDEAISDAMANAGGVGLADVIAKQLESKKNVPAAASEAHGADRTSRPVPLERLAGMALHPVATLVTDPLGNRTVDSQAPVTTGIPATSIGTAGSVSLRRYRAAETAEPPPSSLPASGRTTERR
jgi:Rod binding domain-containing protein